MMLGRGGAAGQGGGPGLAMHADLRIASEASQFGIPAARPGISCGLRTTRALVELVARRMPAWG
jgi:enoyl-CoA hydratase/carnithine racemase